MGKFQYFNKSGRRYYLEPDSTGLSKMLMSMPFIFKTCQACVKMKKSEMGYKCFIITKAQTLFFQTVKKKVN